MKFHNEILTIKETLRNTDNHQNKNQNKNRKNVLSKRL